MTARVLSSIAQIDAASWNALIADGQPFLRHEFLLALEDSGCTVPRTGWTVRHLVIDDARGRPVGALPLYRKKEPFARGISSSISPGANAYAEHGVAYYPKLLSAVPFTPVRGPRLLVRPDADAETMTQLLVKAGNRLHPQREQLSSWHVLFPTEDIAGRLAEQEDWILRRDCQFHWFNQGYDSFDAFLSTFTAEKRIKKAKRGTPPRRRGGESEFLIHYTAGT